jgi:hypothetical protein
MPLIALGTAFLTFAVLFTLTACSIVAVALSYSRACPKWIVISIAAPPFIVCAPLYVLSLFSEGIPLPLKIGLALNPAAAVFCFLRLRDRPKAEVALRPNQPTPLTRSG